MKVIRIEDGAQRIAIPGFKEAMGTLATFIIGLIYADEDNGVNEKQILDFVAKQLWADELKHVVLFRATVMIEEIIERQDAGWDKARQEENLAQQLSESETEEQAENG